MSVVTVYAVTHPFRQDVTELEYAPDTTIGRVVADLGVAGRDDVRCVWGDRVFEPDEFDIAPIGTEYPLIVQQVPGEVVSGVIAAIASAASAAAAAVTGQGVIGAIASGIGGLGLSATASNLLLTGASLAIVVGSSAVVALGLNALIKPPGLSDANSSQSLLSTQIEGTRNRPRPYGAIPRSYGLYRMYFDLIGQYTERAGNDQYLNVLLSAGIGQNDISDIRIGQQSLSGFEDVRVQVQEGGPDGAIYEQDPKTLIKTPIPEIDLYDDDVFTESVGVNWPIPTESRGDLNEVSDWARRTTQPNTRRVSVDLSFPTGLRALSKKGDTLPQSRVFDVRYRKLGTTQWLAPSVRKLGPGNHVNQVISGLGSSGQNSLRRIGWVGKFGPITRGFDFNVPEPGQYEVEVRTSGDSGQRFHLRFADTVWTVMRSFQAGQPVIKSEMTLIALQIRASEQLSGAVDTVNGLVHSMLSTWNGVSFDPPSKTRNPAWIALDVLRGNSTSRGESDSEINLDSFLAWANYCEPSPGSYRFSFDGVFDQRTTKLRTLRLVGSVGRAVYVRKNGKHSMVIDDTRAVTRQAFTPRNSAEARGTRVHTEIPHAFKMAFANEDEDYQSDEVIAYSAGFDETNATKIEDLPFAFGIVNPERAWKEANFQLKQLVLRAVTYERTVGAEYSVLTLGDLVDLSDTVIKGDSFHARIRSAMRNELGDITRMSLDAPMTYIPGESYVIRQRSLDPAGAPKTDSFAIDNLAPGPDDVISNAIVPTTPIPVASAMLEGDLVIFGPIGEERIQVVVTSIEPRTNGEGAVLKFQDYDPALFTDDPAPVHVARISAPRNANPPAPTVVDVTKIADEIAKNNFLAVTLQADDRAPGQVPAALFEIRWRPESPTGDWVFQQAFADQGAVLVGPLDLSGTYTIQARSNSGVSTFSEWVEVKQVPNDGDLEFNRAFRITGLELKNQGNDTEFTGRDAHFTWRLNREVDPLDTLVSDAVVYRGEDIQPFLHSYRVRILDAETGAVRREETVFDLNYVYSFDKQVQDGGAIRRFICEVAFKDTRSGDLGIPSQLLVRNPAPASLTIMVEQTDTTATITYDTPSDPDFAGVLVWAVDDATYQALGMQVPPLSTYLVADEKSNPVRITGLPSSTGFQFNIAAYDDFSKNPQELNLLADSAGTGAPLPGGSPVATDTATLVPPHLQKDDNRWRDVKDLLVNFSAEGDTIQVEVDITLAGNPDGSLNETQIRVLRDGVPLSGMLTTMNAIDPNPTSQQFVWVDNDSPPGSPTSPVTAAYRVQEKARFETVIIPGNEFVPDIVLVYRSYRITAAELRVKQF